MSWLNDWIRISSRLVSDYGYMGIFVVQLVASASLFVPIPGFFVVMAAGAAMDPLLVAISSALGSSVGEFTGYLLGLGGGKFLTQRSGFDLAHKVYDRYGMWTVFIFAATPLPFDIVGILSGILRLHPATFFAMTFLGKFVLSCMLAYGGRQSLRVFEDLLVGKINIFGAVFLLLVMLFVLIPLLYWRYKQNPKNSDCCSQCSSAEFTSF